MAIDRMAWMRTAMVRRNASRGRLLLLLMAGHTGRDGTAGPAESLAETVWESTVSSCRRGSGGLWACQNVFG